MATLFSENFDTYTAVGGLTPGGATTGIGATAGTLNSTVFVLSGWSDLALTSYGQSYTQGDFARGQTSAAVTTGGTYSLTVSGSDRAIWFQPGGSDFDPGFLELRIANNTGATLTQATIAFDWIYRNDQARSDALTLLYSVDGTSFTNLPAAAVTTPAAAAGTGLTTTPESLTVTGLNVAAGGYLYFRFAHASVAGSGSRDEFGVNSLSVTAPDAGPSVSIANVAVAEGNAGTSVATFTVTRTGDTSSAFSIDYATSDGTAQAGSDYVATNGTLNFAAGELTRTVSVTINGDTAAEADETFTVTLSNASTGVIVTQAQATGTITNDDAAVANVSIDSVSVVEGNSGTQVLTFTVTRSDTTGAFTVDFATSDGSATAGSDYLAAAGTLTFTAGGAATQTISVTVNGDTAVESNETLNVTLSNIVNTTGVAALSGAQGVGTITNDDVAVTPIYTIQGAAHLSPLANQSVVTTGVVTGIVSTGTARGYYLQDETGDGNTDTSDAILVFTAGVTPAVAVGDRVRVSGTVTEFRSSGALSLTEITSPTTQVLANNVPLPAAVVLGDGVGERSPPKVLLGDSDVTGVYSPATQGSDFYESLEGMRVTVRDAVSVSASTNSFGEFWVRSTAIASDSLNARGGLTISDTTPGTAQPASKVFDFNPERIKVNDTIAATPQVNAVGDRLGDITGVLSYNFGSYELLPTAPVTVTQASTLTKPATTIVASPDTLRVASFNVRNLSPVGTQDGEGSDGSTQPELTARAVAIVQKLGSPDIVGLQELQDNNGTTNDSVTDASLTLQQLIDAIVAAGGPRYKAIDSNPADDQDGGVPGGNIRVAFLYNPATVAPAASNGLTQDAQPDVLEFDPARRIGVGDANFASTRKSVPIEWLPVGFTATQGGSFYVVDNHFSSKGGSSALVGADLGNPLYGEPVNSDAVKREGQAIALKAFIDAVLADGNPLNDRIISLGDYNDFQFFPVVQLATGAVTRSTVGAGNTDSTFAPGSAVLQSLAELLPVTERYSYNFEGNAQELDHILATLNLVSTAQFQIVHINSEFKDQISDHDPSVSSLQFLRSSALATSGDDVLDQAAFTARFGAQRGDLSGADIIYAGAGADRIYGMGGADTLYGEDGNDVLVGGAGADTLYGGAGNDAYEVTEAGDAVVEAAGEGYDTVYSYLASYTLPANVERLELAGSAGTGVGNALANVIVGNGGANVLIGGAGVDDLYGGAGNDAYEVTDVGDAVTENAGEGYDTVYSYLADYTLTANVERLELVGAATIGRGNALGNVIVGNAGANVLIGGAGVDDMYGGAGNDAYEVTDAGDAVTENPGEGTDTVYSYLSDYTLTANVERLELAGAAVVGRGNGLDNVLVGTAGNNTLVGGAGNDTLIGGAGNDAYEVTEAGDIVIENPGEGTDTVYSYLASYTLPTNVERLELVGSAVVGAGNAGNNILVGDALRNYLNGGAGDDTLTGGGEVDTFYWLGPSAGRDVITDFAPGSGEVVNVASAQFASYAAVQAAMAQVGSDVVITLNAANTLTLQNVLIGQLSSANFSFYSGPY